MSQTPLDEKVAEIRERRGRITTPPWTIEVRASTLDGGVALKYRGIRLYPFAQVPTGYGGISADTNYPDGTPQGDQANRNLEFIAHAPADIDTLLAALEAKSAVIEGMREVVVKHAAQLEWALGFSENGSLARDGVAYVREAQHELKALALAAALGDKEEG